MKRYFLTVMAAMLLAGSAAVAQDNKNDDDDRDSNRGGRSLREYDEIIIKRKDADKDAKVTIEIKGDKVTVDGKPIDEYVNDDVSVRLRNVNRYKLGPSSQFRFDGGNWKMDSDDMLGGSDRPLLGVMTEGSSEGCKIEKVTENSAAAKAGLKTGDVITKVNDKAVFDHEQLSNVINDLKPGDKVTITYKRDGKENKTTATLGKRKVGPMIGGSPDMNFLPPMPFNFEDHDMNNLFELRGKPRLGLRVQDTEEGKGVKVLEVDEGSVAGKAGLKEDDIITSFDGKEVNSAQELAEASRNAKEKTSIKVDLKRNGKSQTIELKVPKKLKTANL